MDIFDEAIEITKQCVEDQIMMNTLEKMAEEKAKVVASLLNYEPRFADANFAAVVQEIVAALRDARNEALEEAGNIAENIRTCGCKDPRNCEACAWRINLGKEISEEIRALRTEAPK
jgi:hypothetical protein